MFIKYFVLLLGAAIVLGVAWWLISPLWRNTRLDEPIPSAPAPTIQQTPVSGAIRDNFDTMDATTREQFKKATDAVESHIMPGIDAMPPAPPSQSPAIIASAPMIARAHEVEGRALLVQAGAQKVLRFEDLKTINGPDLRIYLSSGLNVEDALDLGPIRATRGNVNYTLPEGVDTAKYRNALIWCRAFGVLFSYAAL